MKRAITIILLILFVIVLLFTIWYLLKAIEEKYGDQRADNSPETLMRSDGGQVEKKESSNSNINVNTNIIFNPKAIDKPIEEWQTYKNEKYGFEFKYPEGRVEKPFKSESRQFIKLNDISLGNDGDGWMYIHVVKSWLKYDNLATQEKYQKNTTTNRPHIFRKDDIVENGLGFYEFELWENSGWKPMQPHAEFFNSKHSISLDFSYNISQTYVERVSGTFKFYQK